ncbi:deoxyguanosinetriphosphate triphosphohydrolase, partial [Acidovorax cattleyae]|nr:deoxyguanosinetriphosphate triphosphohydrolase [Paracidovorax cattleyae]
YRHPQVMETTGHAQQVVRDLFGIYAERPSEMKHRFADRAVAAQKAASDNGGMPHARTVADFIAGMTDRFAVREHERLTGQRLLS